MPYLLSASNRCCSLAWSDFVSLGSVLPFTPPTVPFLLKRHEGCSSHNCCHGKPYGNALLSISAMLAECLLAFLPRRGRWLQPGFQAASIPQTEQKAQWVAPVALLHFRSLFVSAMGIGASATCGHAPWSHQQRGTKQHCANQRCCRLCAAGSMRLHVI